MKTTTIQTILISMTLGVVMVLTFIQVQTLIAVISGQTQPQVTMGMPTLQPQPNTETLDTANLPTITPTEISATPNVTSTPLDEALPSTAKAMATLAPTATPATFEAGALLKSGRNIYYIAESGIRQRVYNKDTMNAFGLRENKAIEISPEILESIPEGEPLTTLIEDNQNDLYWLSNGKLFAVNTWKSIVNKSTYTGMPVTRLDSLLRQKLPLASTLEHNALLRSNDIVYALQDDIIIPVIIDGQRVIATDGYGTPVVSMADNVINDQRNIVDIPAEMLEAYKKDAWWYQVVVTFNAETQAANLRRGPGLEQEVVTIITRNDGPITATAITKDGYWLYVTNNENTGWLAIDLIESTEALKLLPTADNSADLVGKQTDSNAQSITTTNTDQIYCRETPIRGFGKVWAENSPVKQILRCPSQYREQGTKAAVQNFQNGWMLWLESDSRYYSDPVYVFFNDGTYQRFGDLGAADPAKVGSTPSGFFPVGEKFSKVYWEGTGAQVKERLGYAIDQVKNSDGAYQQFRNGRMFWAGTIDRIFVIYDYYQYDSNNNRTRIRTWESYEDTF